MKWPLWVAMWLLPAVAIAQTPLAGNEVFPLVSGSSAYKSATANDIKNFTGGGGCATNCTLGGNTGLAGNLTLGGNIATNGSNPTLSACGTSPSLSAASSNFMGTITVGSGSPQTCTVTFATGFPFATAPKCIPQASVSGMPIQAAVTTRSAAAMTIQFSSVMTNGTVDYICTQ